MLLPFFEWMQAHPASLYILDNTWFSPIVQVMHLVALSVFAGSVLIVDLRLLGVGVTGTPLAKVMRDAQPWFIWAFVALVITGTPSMASTAMKQYFSPFFWWKMELLLLGLNLHVYGPTPARAGRRSTDESDLAEGGRAVLARDLDRGLGRGSIDRPAVLAGGSPPLTSISTAVYTRRSPRSFAGSPDGNRHDADAVRRLGKETR